MRSLVALCLGVAACASSGPVDDLAGETAADDAIDGKADSAVDGAYTYFEVWADQRRCASPMCGGFFVARLNRSYSTCVDHSSGSACYVPALDWTESEMPDGMQPLLLDAATADAAGEGVHAIVRGRLAPQTYPQGNLGRFVVTEAWTLVGEAVSDGVFVRAKTNTIQCIAAPCPTITEKALNTSRSANIAAIDWSAAGVDATDQLGTDSGVILAGSRYTVRENGRSAKGRTATAVYQRLVAPAVP